ncbi:TPR repeat protein [Pedobacter africanus]|uniref:TPR repeat protein n=1 Tax=Pedobacter africanus TaxID=151894 RepID=A0ACC6L540_9SPHI|nr:SEL1-like repeat protein [Pedobacter africanus]MDR6786619.1 TPR repeat protein [Pedobacter africanus]
MSHRIYLYNINTPSVAENSDKMMMEWGYEMPLMLQPLLIEGGFVSGNNYNNHVEFNDSGLYYDSEPGIENLKRFYKFLEDQPGLITDMEKFKEARDKLLNYLDKLTGNYFHLDIWDVLNMDDTPHAEQARLWLANIAHNNLIITQAMDTGDVSLLNYKNLKDVSPGFTAFPDLLNYEGYDYGWSCIWVSAEEDLPYEIFEENKLWGLKDKDGRILLQAQFDEFYGFGPQNLAVVSKDGKYGYADTTGRVAIPLVWDDAYDFEYSGVAIATLQQKSGLINTKGGQIIPCVYDELEAIGNGDHFNAKKDSLWGVIDFSGQLVIGFEHADVIEAGYGFYYTKVSGQKNQKIYNAFFKYLGEFPVDSIENLDNGLLLIKPHKGVHSGLLYKKDGTLLDSGFEKINRQTNFNDLLIIRKDKKHGAISRKKECYVLPCQYDTILDIRATINDEISDIALIQQADKKGIYDGNPDKPSWLIPLDDYQQIHWLHDTVFALQRNQLWSIANATNHSFSDFEFDLVVQKPNEDGFAYAFKADQVYSVSKAAIAPTPKSVALEHAGEDYAYYFEYETRKRLLAYGKGINKNEEQIAIELNSAYDLCIMATEAYNAKDYVKSIYYDTLASEKGYALSMNNLAHIYYNIEGLLDDDKAFYWYYKSAMAGNENGMNGLGMCYKHGVGTPVDVEKALFWLNKSTEFSLAIANNNLGDLYTEELLLPSDHDKALQYYQTAADLGEPKHNWLGYLYDLKGDYEKALKYYQLGADEGIDVSAYNLGIFYLNGLGTSKNVIKAIDSFKLSLDLGYQQAHIELARIYQNEAGFKDKQKVQQHLDAAKATGLEIPEDLQIKKKGWFGF